uniref:RYDR_ITPR domain-containing protein n=1 Tax=Meloidogyne hapla TaxID=6305 RepID=A0A1I8C2B2_MELHA
MILETIDKFSAMEALPNFASLIGNRNQLMWEEISTYLYLLVAAMIKGNHSNCAQFAALLRLDWLFGRLGDRNPNFRFILVLNVVGEVVSKIAVVFAIVVGTVVVFLFVCVSSLIQTISSHLLNKY